MQGRFAATFFAVILIIVPMAGLARDGDQRAATHPETGLLLAQAIAPGASGGHRDVSPGKTEIAFRSGRERLSNDTPDWTESVAEVVHEFEKRKLLVGSIGEVSRFGLRDQTATFEAYYPLSERVTGYVMAARSSTHRVLAKDTLQLQLAYTLGNGWGAIAGLRRANYNTTSVDVAELTLERYFSSFRAAASLVPAHSSTAGNASSYRLQFSYYYGDEDRVTLLFSNGTEVDRPTGIDLVIATRVRSSVVFGRHWLSKAWAIDYSLGHTAQGAVDRDAASIGLRYRF